MSKLSSSSTLLALLVLVSASPFVHVGSGAAQTTIPIPGTRASIALPSGCGVTGLGTVTCGTETIGVGGSALSYDEMRAGHVTTGRMVQDVPGTPRSFMAELSGSRILYVREGRDERLVAIGSSERPSEQSGASMARVFLLLEMSDRGAVVTGIEQLDRASIPFPTVYWSMGSLTFTTSAIETTSQMATSGFFRRSQGVTMTTLCDNSSVSSQMRSELLLRHQRAFHDGFGICEEAFVVALPGQRVLAAQFGEIFRGGVAYSVTMTYTLEEGEDAIRCLDGFENFALPALSELLGIGERDANDDDRQDRRQARR